VVQSIGRLHSLGIVQRLVSKHPTTTGRNVRLSKYDTLLLHGVTEISQKMGSAITHLFKWLKLMTEIILKGRLDGIQRNRLKSLFDMLYSPQDLAEEIGISKYQIYYVYVPLGCPHERRERNHISINGKAFAEWYKNNYAKNPLEKDETFCKTCKKGVKVYKPEQRQKKGLVYVLSTCPNCGRKLTRILSEKRGESDQ
jgi:hypothetical protein